MKLQATISCRTKNALLFVLIALFPALSSAQSASFSWVATAGGTQMVSPTSIATDSDGNIYYAGSFMEDVDFDPSAGTAILSSPGYYDAFLCKLDSAGNFIWAKQFTGPYDDWFQKVILDDAGNIYLTVQFYDSLDCNAGTDTNFVRSYGGRNGAIIKLNSNADFVWATPFGGQNYSIGIDLAVNANQEIFVTGRFQGAANFGGVYLYTTSNNSNIFVAKTDVNGGFLWANQMGAPGATLDQGNAISIDAQNNVYSTGSFRGTAQFDTLSFTSVGAQDIYVCKHDNAGNLIWAKHIAASNGGGGNDIGLDANNNIYLVGGYDGTVDADPNMGIFNLSSNGVGDVLVLKLNVAGDFAWAKSYGSAYSDIVRTMCVNDIGDVLVSGIFTTTVDFNPDISATANLTSLGYHDTYLQKLDSAGNFVWVMQIGGSSSEEPREITLDGNENILMTGFFVGTTDFDPSTAFQQRTVIGTQDAFVLKLSNDLLTAFPNTKQETIISLFPNPLENTLYLQLNETTGKGRIELYNSQGQLILSQLVLGNTLYPIDLSSISQGLYSVRFYGENEVVTKKIIVK
jgi:hypothetical protein